MNAVSTSGVPDAGSVQLRQLLVTDLAAAMRLKSLADWNQTDNDWRFFFEADPQGALAAVVDHVVRGTATTIRYGSQFGWVGMVLVDPDFRRMKMGTTLLRASIERLVQAGVPVRLDATPAGKGLYDLLGFIDEYHLQRVVRPAGNATSMALAEGISALRTEDLSELTAMDAPIFGADRRFVLAHWLRHGGHLAFKQVRAGRISGYVLGRAGATWTQIGPLVAPDLTSACALADAALGALGGAAALLDITVHDPGWPMWLAARGFSVQRPFIRMRLGAGVDPGQPRSQFAIAGPEVG